MLRITIVFAALCLLLVISVGLLLQRGQHLLLDKVIALEQAGCEAVARTASAHSATRPFGVAVPEPNNGNEQPRYIDYQQQRRTHTKRHTASQSQGHEETRSD